MGQEINVTAAFILGFSVNFQARHLRFLRYKIFRFRQAQQFIALVGLSFCYFTRTGGALRPCTICAREPSGASIRHFERVWSDHD